MAPPPAAKPGFRIYYVVGIAAIVGLLFAFAQVWLVRRRTRRRNHPQAPPRGKTPTTTKTKEYYIKEALEYIRSAAAKGNDPDEAAAKLIDSGWPQQYVEEARKSVKR